MWPFLNTILYALKVKNMGSATITKNPRSPLFIVGINSRTLNSNARCVIHLSTGGGEAFYLRVSATRVRQFCICSLLPASPPALESFAQARTAFPLF